MLLRPLVRGAANRAAGRKSVMMMTMAPPCSSSSAVVQSGRPACRRWLSGAPADAPPSAGGGGGGGGGGTDINASGGAAAAGASKDDGRTWTWSTPSPNRPGRGGAEISIIPRVNLTVEEVITAVEAQGATDVRKIDLRGKGAGMGDFMVFSTATNPMHMRRMANMVVQALKRRKLVNAMGITGAEGIDCDDWMLVDCDNLIVHFMTAEARQELDLETHWETVASGSALSAKREKGEEGHVEDPVDWDEDFGQEAARAAGRGIAEDDR